MGISNVENAFYPVQFIIRGAMSCLFLRFVLIFKSNVLQNMNVLISKKCAYFRLPCLFSRV